MTTAYLPSSVIGRSSRSIENIALVGWLTMAALVAGFLQRIPTEVIWIGAIVVITCGFVLQLLAPVDALALLPAPLLLGPIARMAVPGGITVHLGDLYLASLLLAALVRDGMSLKLPLGHRAAVLAGIVVTTLMSWLFSADILASTTTMVTLAEFLVIWMLTTTHVRTERDIDSVLRGWLIAVTIASALVIVAYMRRTPLLLGTGEGDIAAAQYISAGFARFWRASFFVTGFIFPLAAVVLTAAAWLVTRAATARTRAILAFALLVNLLAMLVMANATTAGAIAIGIVLLAIGMHRLGRGARPLLLLGAGIALLAIVLVAVLWNLLPKAQFAALLARASSIDSLLERLAVWERVVHFMLNDAKALLVGLGPDITVRRGDLPFVQAMFYGRGAYQRAVDSGYLYLLVNYGFFVFCLVMIAVLGTLRSVQRFLWRHRSDTALVIGVVLMLWMIMTITQQPTVSKPLAIGVQFLALANILVVSRRSIERVRADAR